MWVVMGSTQVETLCALPAIRMHPAEGFGLVLNANNQPCALHAPAENVTSCHFHPSRPQPQHTTQHTPKHNKNTGCVQVETISQVLLLPGPT